MPLTGIIVPDLMDKFNLTRREATIIASGANESVEQCVDDFKIGLDAICDALDLKSDLDRRAQLMHVSVVLSSRMLLNEMLNVLGIAYLNRVREIPMGMIGIMPADLVLQIGKLVEAAQTPEDLQAADDAILKLIKTELNKIERGQRFDVRKASHNDPE